MGTPSSLTRTAGECCPISLPRGRGSGYHKVDALSCTAGLEAPSFRLPFILFGTRGHSLDTRGSG